MEVKKGYKQTEIGVIPEDWEVKTIGDIAKIISGGTPSTNINWFTPTEIGLDKYVYESIRKISNDGLENSSARILPIDTIILTTRAGIGDLSILKIEACTNQGFQSLISNSNTGNEYLYYLLSTLKKEFLKYASGSTFLEISPNKLKSILIPLPSLKEQTAIATALSDTDTWINSLEQLLAKKRQIKQGAMQELLLPKEDWEVKKLGEIFQLSASDSKSNYLSNDGNFIVMDMGSISTDGKIIKNKKTNFEKDLLHLGDLVMPKDDIGGGNIIGKVGYIDMDSKYVLGDHVYKLRLINHNFYSKFFYFLINSNYINKYFRMKASGSAQLGLGRKSVLEQEFNFPQKMEEQTRIATILGDMDDEITQLETKLAKAKQIKQGMMQELLTGRIRLV